jgi:hypothetical protein
MADTKISALTAATAFLEADEFAVNEAGTSKKVTGNQMQASSYAPGSFTVPDGQFRIHKRRLELTGSQRATLEGTARLYVED